jgi:hypothetical protein
MSKPSTSKSKHARVKALPWMAILQVGVLTRKRWQSLSKKERSRLSDLMRQSRGRPGNLNPKERGELRKLAGKLDLKGMPRELMPLVRRGGKRCRRR